MQIARKWYPACIVAPERTKVWSDCSSMLGQPEVSNLRGHIALESRLITEQPPREFQETSKKANSADPNWRTLKDLWHFLCSWKLRRSLLGSPEALPGSSGELRKLRNLRNFRNFGISESSGVPGISGISGIDGISGRDPPGEARCGPCWAHSGPLPGHAGPIPGHAGPTTNPFRSMQGHSGSILGHAGLSGTRSGGSRAELSQNARVSTLFRATQGQKQSQGFLRFQEIRGILAEL